MKSILTCYLFFYFCSAVASDKISFYDQEKKLLKTTDLRTLANIYTKINITARNENTLKTNDYNAFNFIQILESIYGPLGKLSGFFGFKISASDGYEVIIEHEKFMNRKPFLAFGIKGKKLFQMVSDYKDEMVDLSPFYLIWKEKYRDGVARRRNHWVYKIKSIQLIKESPPELLPGKDASTSISLGHKNYLKQCYSCHQINWVGSDLGGELILNNKIKNFEIKYIQNYISNPRKINPKAKMPKFPENIVHRRDRIINISNYLKYMDEKLNSKKNEATLNRKSYHQLLKVFK